MYVTPKTTPRPSQKHKKLIGAMNTNMNNEPRKEGGWAKRGGPTKYKQKLGEKTGSEAERQRRNREKEKGYGTGKERGGRRESYREGYGKKEKTN
jgi:hypothetical protein